MSEPGEAKARRILVTKLYESGLKRKAIVGQTGFTENQVKALLTRIRNKKDTSDRDTMREARRETVINTYKEMGDTVSLAEIARILGVSKGCVCGILTRTRGIRHSRGTLRDKWGGKAAQVRDLCSNAVTDSAIAEQLGFPSANAVQAFRKRRGIFGPRTKKDVPQQPYKDRYQKPLSSHVHDSRRIIFDIAAKSEVAPLLDEVSEPVRKVRDDVYRKGEVIAPVFRVAVCQWPMWQGKTEFKENGTPHFCGAPSAGSWCVEHRRRVFTTPERWARQVQQALQQSS